MDRKEKEAGIVKCEELIKDMDKRIAALTKQMKDVDPKSPDFERIQKKLKACNRVKKDSIVSIFLYKRDLDIQTNPRFRGLPYGVTITNCR